MLLPRYSLCSGPSRIPMVASKYGALSVPSQVPTTSSPSDLRASFLWHAEKISRASSVARHPSASSQEACAFTTTDSERNE